MILSSLSAIGLLSGCASPSAVVVDKQVPQELVKPELPAWRQWSETYTTWLKSATQDGTDALVEKMR
jgi:hypothetical protein